MLADSAIRKEDEQKAPLIRNASIRQQIIQMYMVLLKSCFRRPMFTVVSGLVLFFVTIALGLFISMSSPTAVETTEMNMFVTMPQGSTLESTDLTTRKIEEKVMAIPVIEKVISQVSEGQAVITVKLVEGFNDLDTISVANVRNRLTGISRNFKDVNISLERPPSQTRGEGGGAGSSASAVGGAVYSKYTMELRYLISPNPQSKIYALAFLEAGNAWQDVRDFQPFKLNRSVGVGVRIFLPMFGLLGVDYGYGFDPIPGVNESQRQKGVFHFMIGQQF